VDTSTKTAKCLRCGRTLTAARSIAANYGRTCKARIATAVKTTDLAEYKPAQVTKAVEVIELGGIVRTSAAHFAAVSSDGSTSYQVDQTERSCTCKAGERGLRCYHLAAADILAASTTRTTSPTSTTAPDGAANTAEGLDRTPPEVPAMPPIVRPNPFPSWSSALHATQRFAIFVSPSSKFEDRTSAGTWDREKGVMWLNADLLGDDALIDEYVRHVLVGIADYHRPNLTVAGKPAAARTASQQPTTVRAEQPIGRPALRLVAAPNLPAACLAGCEYSSSRAHDNAQGEHLCSTTLGRVETRAKGTEVYVSVDRYQGTGASKGVDPAMVAMGRVTAGCVPGEPEEMTPAAARALAARLLEAADLAERANREQDAAARHTA